MILLRSGIRLTPSYIRFASFGWRIEYHFKATPWNITFAIAKISRCRRQHITQKLSENAHLLTTESDDAIKKADTEINPYRLFYCPSVPVAKGWALLPGYSPPVKISSPFAWRASSSIFGRGCEPAALAARYCRFERGSSSKTKNPNHKGWGLFWSCYPDLNRGPHPYQGCALPTEP